MLLVFGVRVLQKNLLTFDSTPDEIEYKAILIDECTGCEGTCLDVGETESISKLENQV